MNLGGPDSLNAVRPFLFNLFSDREIIRLGPSFMQKPIAWLISMLRAGKTIEAYRLIGGRSPINENTFAQAKALEKELNSFNADNSIFRSFKVFVAMRYWHPMIKDVVPQIYKQGIRRLIALSLYPQYSVATTGSTLAELQKVVSRYGIEVFSIKSWFNHPRYIDALVETIRNGLNQLTGENNNPHVLFSAHSLPVKFIEEGDPYEKQIMGTINEILKRIDIKWSLSYQSKSGPVKWLEPSTDKMIEELSKKGVRNLLVVPISFVSDHIETLYEIDILYKNLAHRLGINLKRTESLNMSELFISALKEIVFEGLKESGWQG